MDSSTLKYTAAAEKNAYKLLLNGSQELIVGLTCMIILAGVVSHSFLPLFRCKIHDFNGLIKKRYYTEQHHLIIRLYKPQRQEYLQHELRQFSFLECC
jgi:hypothetical protein